MNLFKSLGSLAGDVIDIVTAPVQIAVDLTRVTTKPLADMAKEVAGETNKMVKEVTNAEE